MLSHLEISTSRVCWAFVVAMFRQSGGAPRAQLMRDERERMFRKWEWQAVTSCSHYNISFPYFISVKKIKHIPYNMQLWQMNPSISFILANPLKLTLFNFAPLHGDHRNNFISISPPPPTFLLKPYEGNIHTNMGQVTVWGMRSVLIYCLCGWGHCTVIRQCGCNNTKEETITKGS